MTLQIEDSFQRVSLHSNLDLVQKYIDFVIHKSIKLFLMQIVDWQKLVVACPSFAFFLRVCLSSLQIIFTLLKMLSQQLLQLVIYQQKNPEAWTWEKTNPLKTDHLEKPALKALKRCHLSHVIWKTMLKWFMQGARFRANNVRKVCRKFLFWKQESWYKNDNYQFPALMKCFRMFTHFM